MCPGQYNYKSFTEQMEDRVVSKRGPYDLFTADRNKAIITGHLSAPVSVTNCFCGISSWLGRSSLNHFQMDFSVSLSVSRSVFTNLLDMRW